MEYLILTISSAIAVGAAVFVARKRQQFQRALKVSERDMQHRMYELAILKELGERIGYSLNVEQIIDIITGSLRQFLSYSAVSYMLLGPENVIFKVHLEQSVSRKFVDDIEDRMRKSLSALLNKEFQKSQVKEVLSGAILVEDVEEPVRSFFNIPLVIAGKVVGVLTIAHTEAGLYKEEEMTMLYKIMQQASNAVTRLQEVVETEERKLNAMVESMAEGVVMTDRDYRMVVVNPAAKTIINVHDGAKEVTIFDFIDTLSGAFDIRGKLEASVTRDEVLSADDVLIKDRFYKIMVSPVKSTFGMHEGEVLGGVVIFHDITKEKELEKMREDFTSMMVHELRSPLDGIKKMTEVLKEGSTHQKSDKEYGEYLSLIYDGSSHMLDLVNDLLDVAKLEAGKFELHKELADIPALLHERQKFYESSAKEKNLTLSVALDPRIPKQIALDPVRVSQVLNNFISNSLKFTGEGGKITLQAFVHRAGEDIIKEAHAAGMEWIGKEVASVGTVARSIIVAVTDTGIGIEKKNIPKLFSKFTQFTKEAVRSEKRGTGLGLVIAKGIVEAQGGIIAVSSEEGVGSTFFFTVPYEEENAGA